MNDPNASAADREKQVKFAQSRVAAVEKYYGLLCSTLGSVVRKSARLRNKGDAFAYQLKEYAETEKLSTPTKTNLLVFAENFSTVQDYRNTEVQRLEAKVLKPLTKYGVLCKNMKSSIKGNQTAWAREKKQTEKLTKLRQKAPSTTPQIAKAQADLQRMQQQTFLYEEQLLTEVDKFEKSKIADLKSVLSEFVQIEMMFHARALEYLSRCYAAAQNIETEVDMDHFRVALQEAGGRPQAPITTAAASSLEPTNSSFMRPKLDIAWSDADEDDSDEEDDDEDDDES